MGQKQQTISRDYTFSGKGLHTGVEVTMHLLPAPENHGVKFCRTDLDGNPTIDALAEYVKTTERGTLLKSGDTSVATVEHILSALYALGADNVLIELNGPEVPIMDGSAGAFASAISKDGLKDQEADKRVFVVKEKLFLKDEVSGSEITLVPDDVFSADVMIDFNSALLGCQFARYNKETDYTTEIAPSRTFVFLHDVLKLYNSGLIKGGNLENAVILAEEEPSQLEQQKLEEIYGKRDIKLTRGYLNTRQLKYPNECARHKLCDLLGDISLSGVKIVGKITAVKPGHTINTQFAGMIKKAAKEAFMLPDIPLFDPSAEPLMDINAIKRLLPHRPPFLMVDRIIEIGKDRVTGIKTIGINEGFFIGHFPDEPVMPGVLILEAMAQVGGILVMSELDEPERYSTYFAKIDNAKFKRKVVPGDVLIIKLTVTAPLRRSIVAMRGEVYVGNTLACEADLVAQVIKNK